MALKYGSRTKPVAARTSGRWPASVSSAQIAARTAVLPDDGAVQRLPGGAVEGHQGLALVRDAEGGDGVLGLGEAGTDLGQRGPHGVPDLGRIVLHPAGAREVLGQLPVGHVGHRSPLVDHEGTHAGRARIDGDDLGHGRLTLTPRGNSAPRRRIPWACGANNRERPVTCTDSAWICLTRA